MSYHLPEPVYQGGYRLLIFHLVEQISKCGHHDVDRDILLSEEQRRNDIADLPQPFWGKLVLGQLVVGEAWAVRAQPFDALNQLCKILCSRSALSVHSQNLFEKGGRVNAETQRREVAEEKPCNPIAFTLRLCIRSSNLT